MGGNVGQIIELTFVVIILAWILTHASEFGQVATAVGSTYTQGVGALMPSGALTPNP